MPDFIGNIEVPEVAASGTFPFITDFPSEFRRDYRLEIHPMANTAANLKIEQRFLIGTGARVFQFRRAVMSLDDRNALVTFWEARKGSWQPFTYNAPSDDGASTSAVTVRFYGPLTIRALPGSKFSVQCELIEHPTSGPTYTLNSTETRFPGSSLETELLEQDQEIIPLVHIVVREAGYPNNIYLSNRRCTVGSQLYQARLLDYDGISQATGGETDQAQFSFGNADRVMRDLAADTNLNKATVEFSLFNVALGIKLDVWKGYCIGFSGDAADEFSITANDGIDLNLMYPTRLCGRHCWKPYDDGLNCNPPGTLDAGFPDADLASCDHTYDGPNGCRAHDNERQFGGHIIVPQGVNIKDNSTGRWGMGRQMVNATSLVADSIDGIPLAEIWTARDIPVSCLIAASRDESDFRDALGIVGAGPLLLSTNVLQHTLNGFPPHQVDRGTLRAYGIRLSSGPEPEAEQTSGIYPADSDHWFQLTDTSGPPAAPVFAAGTAFAEIRIADEPGIQPRRTTEDQMTVVVSGGLPGYQWTDSTTRILSHPLNVPSWVLANMLFRAKAIFPADATTQAALINVESFMDAGIVCQTTVDKLIGSGTEVQFEFTCEMRSQKPLRDWMTDVAGACLGYWYFEYGKLAFGQRINSSAEEAFTLGNIIQGSLDLQGAPPAYNALTVEFDEENPDTSADRSQAFIRRTIEVADYDHIDAYGRIPGFLTLNGVAGRSQALRIGAVTLREELGGISAAEWAKKRAVRFRTTILAMATRVGMVCSLTHPDMPGGAGEFRIKQWRLLPDMSIEIEGITTTDSMYDLTVGPKPEDVLPDPLPLERVEHFLPLQPWFPDAEAPHADDPLWSETEKTFHVEQTYEVQADGSAGAIIKITGDHPTTTVIANTEPPRVGTISTAATGGSLPNGTYLVVCISAVDSSGNETRASKPMGVQCGLTGGGTHKVTLGDITWPAGTTGYRVYASPDSFLLCRQLENSGSQPSSIDVTSVSAIRTQGIPQENLYGLQAHYQRCWHPGVAELTVTAVGAGTITGNVTTWTPSEWTGRVILILGDQSDGSAPPLAFTITDNGASTFTCSPDPQAAGVEAGDQFTILSRATAATSSTITDSKFENAWSPLGLDTNEEAGRIVKIIRGMGEGQERLVTSNTSTALTVSPPWSTTPDTTSYFVIVEATAHNVSDVERLTSQGETVEIRIAVPNLVGAFFVNVATIDSAGREPQRRYNPWRLIHIFGDVGTGIGAVAPGDVTLGTPSAPFFLPPDPYGVVQIGFTVPYTPPSPVGSFDRVRLYLQAPDNAARNATISDDDDIVGFVVPDDITVTVDAGTDVWSSTGHPFLDTNAVRITNTGGSLPGGVSGATTYYVRDKTANTFKLALTSGGSAIDVTSAGSGTHRVIWAETSFLVPTVEPVDKGIVPYRPEELILTVRHPAPALTEYWRLYAVSGSPEIENLLSRADEENPTPNVVLTAIPPPQVISGAEYAPVALSFSVVTAVQYYQGDGGQWLWYLPVTWTNPVHDPRYALLSGYDLVVEYATGERETDAALSKNSAPHTTLDRAVPAFSEPVKLWLVSYDGAGQLNSIVHGVTPMIQVTIQRPVGSSGQEYAPLVTDYSASSEWSTDGSGHRVLVIRTEFTRPAGADYGGVTVWADTPDISAPGNALTGIETGSATLSWINEYPADQQDWDIYFISADRSNRSNSFAVGVTPKVTITIAAPVDAVLLPNVTGFSVAYAYVEYYYGKKVLRLTPTFTKPSGEIWSYAEFWAKREDASWYHLGNPAESGLGGAAFIEQLPESSYDWEFKLISNDVNGKDRNGDPDSNPASPPTGTPSYTLTIPAPTGGLQTSLEFDSGGVVTRIQNETLFSTVIGLVCMNSSGGTFPVCIGPGRISIHPDTSSGTLFNLSGNPPVITMYDQSSNERIRLSPLSTGATMSLRNSSTSITIQLIASSGSVLATNVDVTDAYYVNGTKVVGARGSSVTGPSGGSTVDAEARTAINTIISRLQAHGLIS